MVSGILVSLLCPFLTLTLAVAQTEHLVQCTPTVPAEEYAPRYIITQRPLEDYAQYIMDFTISMSRQHG